MDSSYSDGKPEHINTANSSLYPPNTEERNSGGVDATDVAYVAATNNNSTFKPEDLYYDMSGHKHLFIFNHRTYEKSKYFKGKPTDRKGTDKDVESLKSVFGKLQFKILIYNDKPFDVIITTMKNISQQNHEGTSCLCFVIMTHGEEKGELFAKDRPYKLQDITSIFENGHESLVNKPKLFFIQACRGGNFDAGRTVMYDGGAPKKLTVPTHADFLIMRSTVEGFVSWRDVNGSWAIQTLCEIIEKYHDKMDILQMITLVNQRVAYERASYTPSQKVMHNKKQMPETRYTLTKLCMLLSGHR